MGLQRTTFCRLGLLAMAALPAALTSSATARADAVQDCIDLGGDVSVCTKAIKARPNDPRLFFRRGLAYLGKDLDRAIADYDQAIRLDPKYKEAYLVRCNAWRHKDDYDHAIADCDQAIRLDPNDMNSIAYRAGIWFVKGDFDRALADFQQASSISANLPGYLYARGKVYLAKGDFSRGIAECDEAIRLEPKNAAYLLCRGIAHFYAGSLPNAVADLARSNEFLPTWAYLAIWYEIANRRSNLPSRLSQSRALLDGFEGRVMLMFLDRLTPEVLLAEASANPDATTKRFRICLANFFSGELALSKGSTDEATRRFGLATEVCPKDTFESWAAVSELRALAPR